jgi:hypothetical protein
MKHLVRNKSTQAYLCADGRWTMDYSVAVSFQDTVSLVQATQALNRADLERVLMICEQPLDGYDVILPVGSESAN